MPDYPNVEKLQYWTFFIDLKRKTQLQLTYRYIYLCLLQQEKTRSHHVPAIRLYWTSELEECRLVIYLKKFEYQGKVIISFSCFVYISCVNLCILVLCLCSACLPVQRCKVA